MFNSKAILYQDPGVGGPLRLTISEIHDHAIMIGERSIFPIEGGLRIRMPSLGSASAGMLALVSDIFPFTGY
jgi:hypothetical protein